MLQLSKEDGQAAPVAIRREDYTAPAYWIDSVELTFDLDPAKTRVLNRMTLRRNADVPAQPLRLDGEDLNLARVLVNGQGTSFKMDGGQLVLENLPEGTDAFALEIFTTCARQEHQAHGPVREQRFVLHPVRGRGFPPHHLLPGPPGCDGQLQRDAAGRQDAIPVLLSNGNLVDSGDLEDGRHFAKWVDPHKKPCYLFALVAGKLVAREQNPHPRGHRPPAAGVRAPGDLGKTEHAMNSLMASIAWDEARFGLPLDLERFMIVATSDFNMGAMENKGLNIFNTKYVLASEATATDTDFANIESVVGHEYFPQLDGNRVTCRDWFQLSLKEGLTVFRDQEFSMDLAGSPRPAPSSALKTCACCAPPSSPKTQAPWPTRCGLTATSRSTTSTPSPSTKRSEVVRMQHNLVGRDGFARA